ncbi:MAG: LacI family transcriptional regulator [Anaerolineae bacterium]|nr:LacI family transcriptional regulator [Anaerolineae bacterium]
MATLKDVAKRASVSVSTASRILSNSPKEKFAEETQVKVLRASLELGYHPNFAARALASGRSRIVAVVFPRIYDTPFTALASLQILAGIETFCSQNGYHVLLSSPRIVDGKVDSAFRDLLAGGYPDGIIVDGHFGIDSLMEIVQQFDLPTVMLGYHLYPYYLRSDNFLGGSLVMQHLIDLGHRQIGIIGLPDGVSPAADQRLHGMRFTAEDHGINFAMLPRADGNFSADSGAAAAQILLTEHPELTALSALNDRMAMGAIRQLRMMRYQIPDQVSVIGYDDLPQALELDPPLTTINQQLASWGSIAMNMLQDLLEGRQPEPVILPPRLMIRQSSAPLWQVTEEGHAG